MGHCEPTKITSDKNEEIKDLGLERQPGAALRISLVVCDNRLERDIRLTSSSSGAA